MKVEAKGSRVRIYLGSSDEWHGKALYVAIVQEARRRGLAGTTVMRGVMGFGARSVIHEPHVFSFSTDLPIVVEIVDSPEKVRAFLPCLDEMVQEGMITISDCDIVRYAKS